MWNKWRMPGVLRPGREQPAAGTGSGALWANSKRATESHWLPNATFYTNKEKKKIRGRSLSFRGLEKFNKARRQFQPWASGSLADGHLARLSIPMDGQKLSPEPGLSLGTLKNHSIPNKQERERAYGGSSLAPRFQMLWGSPLKEAQGARRWEGRRLRMHRTFT